MTNEDLQTRVTDGPLTPFTVQVALSRGCSTYQETVFGELYGMFLDRAAP